MDYIYTAEPIEIAAATTAKAIVKHLACGERVLWLLSGGSGVPIAIKTAQMLKNHDLSNLYVSLTDERYGAVGHKDENWQQLLDGGFSLPSANLYRPLTGQDIGETTNTFSDWLNAQLKKADYKIGIFGLGADGHTAGIKPHSPAVTSSELTASFTGSDFQRVTISFAAIRQISEAVIQASGDDKRQIIHELINNDASLDDQPAQILKTIPRSTIFTNNKETDQ